MAGAALLAVAAYAMTLGFEFVYDDVRLFEGHPEFRSLSNWREILTSSWWPTALYRPLTQLTFALDFAVSGGNPAYFHGVNILLHALATAAVYVLARAALRPVGAFVAAALFAVHPVHVEAVASVVGRAEVLAALFTVVAAVAYERDGDLADGGDQSWRRYLATFGTLVSLGLGVASKESALAIPGVLLIVDWLAGRRTERPFGEMVRRHAPLWFAAIAMCVGWLVLRSSVLGDVAGDRAGPGLYGLGIGGRVWVMAPVILQYARLFFFPLHLSADYSPGFLPAEASVTLLGLAGLSLLAAAIGAAYLARNRAPVVTFALAWVGGTLLVVSNVLVPSGVMLAERTMYVPSVGIAILAGWGAQVAWSRHRRATTLAVSVVAILAAVRTVTRVPVWRDANAFFPRLVTDAPHSHRSLWVAAMVYYAQGHREAGEDLLRRALIVVPTFPNTWSDFGRQLQSEERWEEAARAFRAAFVLGPEVRLYDGASAVTNFVRAGMVDTARVLLDAMIEIDPLNDRVLLARADIAGAEGRHLAAMTWRRRAAFHDGTNPNYWFLTAESALRAEYCPEVVHAIERVRALNPDFEHLDRLEAGAEREGCRE